MRTRFKKRVALEPRRVRQKIFLNINLSVAPMLIQENGVLGGDAVAEAKTHSGGELTRADFL